MDVGAMIERARTNASLTQEELGYRAGVGKYTIHKIETGKRRATAGEIAAIAADLAEPELLLEYCAHCAVCHALIPATYPGDAIPMRPEELARRAASEAGEARLVLQELGQLLQRDWADDPRRVGRLLVDALAITTRLKILAEAFFLTGVLPVEPLVEANRIAALRSAERARTLEPAA